MIPQYEVLVNRSAKKLYMAERACEQIFSLQRYQIYDIIIYNSKFDERKQYGHNEYNGMSVLR